MTGAGDWLEMPGKAGAGGADGRLEMPGKGGAEGRAGAAAAFIESLNPSQRRAALHSGSPLLILAGAGSGKTRVITAKIAWLISEGGLDPRSILAVTFTNRAAREMAERAARIDERASGAMLRTFHSFGAWVLRRSAGLCGLQSGFVIYDDGDMASLLSTIMKGAGKAEMREAARKISRAKDYFLSPGDAGLAAIDGSAEFRGLYAQYERRLAEIGNADFGDLIKKPVEMMRSHPEAAERLRRRFSAILVDEYQDANVAQFELLKEIASPGAYVCVVGDDDQSIYRFRGAEVRNILEFPEKFPGAEVIRLESNYRSTAPILRAASSVVDCNRGRLGKTLRAERGGGKQPALAFLPDQDEEAAFCAALIENSARQAPPGDGGGWSDWAVLYRTNAQSLGFETEFLRRGIPYRVVGSLKFYEREEVKDALALLSLLANPRDEVAFRRVANKPARGLGAAAIERIAAAAQAPGASGSFLEAAKAVAPELKPKAAKGLAAFLKAIEGGAALLSGGALQAAPPSPGPEGSAPEAALQAAGGPAPEAAPPAAPKAARGARARKRPAAGREGALAPGDGLSLCAAQMIAASGLADYHLERDEVAGSQRLSSLQELANAASLYPGTRMGLLEFLESIELDRSLAESAGGDGEDRATLITFHNTKGLEFRKVIMTGLEQGVFPREDKKGEELEEERRLFYVGATRAMDELYLTSCARRRMFGRTAPAEPSAFLSEIDKACLRILGRPPPGFGAAGGLGGGAYGSATGGASGGRGPAAAKAEGGQGLAGWRRGQKVFHDDHGYGYVTEARESEDGPTVAVRFETGRETRFLAESQGAAFEKIGDDA